MPCDCKNEGVPSIPFVAYESEMTRNERHIKRLIVALIAAVAAIFLSNAAWLYAWCQYDYTGEVITIASADGGNANYIGNDGDIYNGEDYSEKALQNAEENQRREYTGPNEEA